MKFSRIGITLLLLSGSVLLLFLCAACGIDYRLNAAERARSYALKHTRDLSETDRDFIRYNDPEIMTSLIFPGKVPERENLGTGPNRFDTYEVKANPNYDYMHTAFVWKLPKGRLLRPGRRSRGTRSAGMGSRLHHLQKIHSENTAYSAAHLQAVTFLVNFFPDLSFANINRARFSEPMVLPTDFPLEDPAAQSREKQMKKWMDYIRTGKGLEQKPIQISLVWTSPLNGDKIVVCGTAPQENLIGWTPKKAMILKPDELDAATVKNKKVNIRDPRNEKGEQIITPELNPHKTIEMKVPDRPRIRG